MRAIGSPLPGLLDPKWSGRIVSGAVPSYRWLGEGMDLAHSALAFASTAAALSRIPADRIEERVTRAGPARSLVPSRCCTRTASPAKKSFANSLSTTPSTFDLWSLNTCSRPATASSRTGWRN